MTLRTVFRSTAIDEADIERDARGLPTAFRIWTFGINPTSKGNDLFDEKAVALIKTQIEEHVSQFPFDIDHLSLKGNARPDDKKAAGWHTLGFREAASGPECWAENCEWTPESAEDILAEPPRFKFFSPAFSADEEGRVVRYINCALTNTPASFGIPSFRSEGIEMNPEQVADALGLQGDARAAFIASIAGKSAEEIASTMMAPAATTAETESSAAVASGEVSGVKLESATDAPSATATDETRSAVTPEMRRYADAQVRARIAPAARSSGHVGTKPPAKKLDPATIRVRNALGIPLDADPEVKEGWLTTTSGTCFRIRNKADQQKATEIAMTEESRKGMYDAFSR